MKAIQAIALLVLGCHLTSSLASMPNDEIRDLQWHLDALNVSAAQIQSRGQGVIVGVIDTGVDANHPDLAANVLSGIDYTEGATTQGREDIDGHGTSMAGLIAANGRAKGIAPDAKILPIRIHPFSTTFAPDIGNAIIWAIEQGATVLCLAFGRGGPASAAEERALARAAANNVIVVAAVGNTTNSSQTNFPAGYDGVVVAAGTGRTGDHAPISLASANVDLAAPATAITSTTALNRSQTGYSQTDGTSNSTAIVAGVAALVRSKYPDLSAAEVIHRLTATADDKGPPGRDDEYGYGIVNPVRALTEDVPPLTPSVTSSSTAATAPPAGHGPNTGLIVVLVGAGVLLTAGLVIALVRRRT